MFEGSLCALSMKNLITILLSITLFYSFSANAWQYGLSFGAGAGQETNRNYNNGLFMVNGKFYKFNLDRTLIATFDARFSHLFSATPENNSMYTLSLAPAFRAYFFEPFQANFRPYLEVSSGPAYLSQHQLGEETQGARFAIQSTLGGGFEWAERPGFEVNFQLVHYCNAGLANPNQGFNFPIVISFGYLW